ncbi:polymorphic toxin-type HINT domain-containing protein [Paractinoplanes atraurantiacus]|uniref:Intein C-terminal splicing region/RHS repeat-associated core domain-containing protein n=1 Tax=Paractinoplanes atraurantiacus TaxID=1036182 RepID=A0A285J0M3_9ACTN|nr:polymorphic toxin-type HINT domain-containing protein [Actinoplanes atraurantiacus]SNY53633.1 intein C-terminal splicing region/RHS repeat-associated core domain-containing protein [Actinoplanes atraurantiacus]
MRARRRRLLSAALTSVLISSYLAVSPPGPATAAPPPVAPAGADPVDRGLPKEATPNHGRPAGEVAPPVPPAVESAGKPAKTDGRALRRTATAKAVQADAKAVAAEVPGTPIVRPGFTLGDTSLVVYFDAQVADGDPTSWARWWATVRDVEAGTEQRSTDQGRADLSRCSYPATFCRTFGAAEGWVLDPARKYTVTITVAAAEGELSSAESAPAQPRTVVNPPAVPASQAVGCGCATVLGGTVRAQAFRGQMVNTGTGTFQRVEQDFGMPSYGIPFRLARYYSSGNTAPGMFGPGWSSTYDIRIVSADGGAARVRAEDGSEAVYTGGADGSYEAPAGVRARLTKVDGGWQLVPPDKRVLRFDAEGKLISIKNARGHGVTLAYTAQGVIDKVTDASGRVVDFDARADLRLVTKVTMPDNRVVQFDYEGTRLLKVQDARRYTTTYGYDAAGRLATVVDARGNRQVFNEYDAAGRVGRQTDAENAVTTFAWNAGSQEATTTDPDGVVVVDGYRDNVLLWSRNGNNDVVNTRYDGKLQKSLVVDPKGNQEETAFDAAGNPRSRTAPEPFSFTQSSQFDGRGNLTEFTDGRDNKWIYTYNEFNELTSQRDPEQAKGYRYEYDSRGNVVKKTDPRDKATTYEYDTDGNRTAEISPTGRKTVMAYDRTGRMTSVVDPRGTVSGANPDAYRTRYTYDEENTVVEVRQPGKQAPYKKTLDELGQVVVVTDPLSGSTHTTYDKAGRPVLVKDQVGNTSAAAYTPAGRRKSVTVNPGELNLTTSWTYDSTGRVSLEVAPLGNANPAQAELYTSRFHYDFNGNLVQADRPYGSDGKRAKVDTAFDALDRPNGQVDQLDRRTSVRYDNAGNVVGMTNENGEELTSSFDGANRRTGSTAESGGVNAGIEYDDAGNPVKQTTPTGGVVTWKYDDDGRPIEITEPRGNVEGTNASDYTTKYGYDRAGNLETVTDPLGNVSKSTYDANDRLIASTDANNRTTRLGYNDNDWLTSVIGPDAANGQALTYQYRANGQLERRTDPLNRSAYTEYDKAGRTVATTDQLGRRREYVYDANSQLVQEITARMVEPNRPDPNIPAKTIFYGYDNLGRLISKQLGDNGPISTFGYDAKNKLTAATDPSGTQVREYDNTDRLTKVIRGDQEFGYTYDGDDRIISRSYPDGTKISAEYDDGDRITSLTSAKGGSSSRYEFGYDVSDNLIKTTYPASTGVVEERGYDRAGRMTRIAAGKGDTVLSAFDLQLDKVGNPTRITETKGQPGQPTVTEATAYNYDAANRLTAECFGAQSCAGSSAERTDYTYDLVGNRTTKKVVAPGENTTTSYTYDAADQLTNERITGSRSNERSFEYDLEGNQIRAGNNRFTYALDHTMTSATVDGKTTDYTYDAVGNRIKAVTGSGAQQVVQNWLWDINSDRPLLAAETQTGANGDVSRGYLYNPGGQALAMVAGNGGTSSYLHDWLGGVSGMVSANGTPQWSYDYDAFGVARGTGLTDGGRKLDADAPANPVQYAGTYRDVSQGDRYAMGARNYDPSTGRFDSADPAAQPATDPAVSTYSYTNARPTVWTDPSGLDPDSATVPFLGSATAAEYRMNNPEAAATTVVANNPDGTTTVEVENPEWMSAKKLVDEAEGFVKQIGDEIVNLILDLVGFNDAKACVTEGDIVACISTALQAVPWGKLFKAAKVAVKAIGVGRRLVETYGRLKAARAALSSIPQRITKVVGEATNKVKSAAAKQVENTVAAAKDLGAKAKATTQKAAGKVKQKRKSTTGESCDIAAGAGKRLASANSFAAGTLVLMADGSTKPIEKVQPGDTVKATNDETGVSEPQQVTASVTGSGDKSLVELTLAGAGAGGGGPPQKLTATAGHKFYSPAKGWTEAEDLKAGDTLRDPRGRAVTITRTVDHSETTTVYNLTVNDTHTYYVVAGDESVLVHNCGGALAKHSTKCTCAQGGTPRIVRNPYGRAGGPAHQRVIDQVERDLQNQGFTTRREVPFSTPTGFKPNRAADVAAYDANGTLVSVHQVGLQTKGGLPVMRETEAMSDIWSELDDGVEMVFHPYGTVK